LTHGTFWYVGRTVAAPFVINGAVCLSDNDHPVLRAGRDRCRHPLRRRLGPVHAIRR
jgi:hypothetical protein